MLTISQKGLGKQEAPKVKFSYLTPLCNEEWGWWKMAWLQAEVVSDGGLERG